MINITRFVFSIFFLLLFQLINAQSYVLTQRGNNKRTGANTKETILKTSNVTLSGFGKLFDYQVDGHVYAQPLYVPDLELQGKGKRNVVFIATMHNSLYAYDADSLLKPLWKTNVGTSCPVPDPNFGYRYGPYHDIKVEIGITSTPVIDTSTNTLYAVAFTKENGKYYHKICAIDIKTGNFKTNPVIIQATITGKGAGSLNNKVAFQSKQQLQRVALVLSKGIIYIVFAGYADTDPYHGWVLGYDAATLTQKYVFNTTPNGGEGGIWMSGQGPSVDENGDIYLSTGNGDYTANTGGTEYGDSFLKLRPLDDSLKVMDYFTPYNQEYLQQVDADLGVDAPIIIPNSNLIVGGSKEGKLYVVDRTSMGGYNETSCNCDNQIVQSFWAFNGHLHGSVAYWDGPNGGYIYGWSEYDNLKAFKRNGNQFDPTPSSKSVASAPGGMPGGIVSISSNGTIPGTGIVWANIPYNGDANTNVVTGVLRAFNAADVSKELWNNRQNTGRDGAGNFAKFNSPVVVNGKVYLPTFSGQVSVYGLYQMREADNPSNVLSGLNYKYCKGSFDSLPVFNNLNPVKIDTIGTFSISRSTDAVDFAYSFEGFINITVDGVYTFYLSSDDGSDLQIGHSLVIDNDYKHTTREKQGSIGLKAGMHAIKVNYFQSETTVKSFAVSYSRPGVPRAAIPASVLFRIDSPLTSVNSKIEKDGRHIFLHQNYPNPVLSNQTTIEFGSDRPGKATIALFRLDGTQIKVLFNGDINEKTSIDINTQDLSNGIYMYRMITDDIVITKSLLIIK